MVALCKVLDVASIRTIINLGDGVALLGTGDAAQIYRLDHMRTPGNGLSWVPVELTITADGGWHTLNTAGAKEIRIGVQWSSTTATHTMYFYTRRRGSVSNWEGIAEGAGNHCSMVIQACDNPTYPGDIEYKCAYDSGTLVAYLVGYIS
jgi:hypothetical protein